MCSGFEWAMVAAATVSTGATLMQKTPQIPDLPPLQEPKLAQTEKDARSDTARAIKSAKKREGTPAPPTLLTGAGGIGDEEINLGGQALAPGKTWV